MQVGEEAAGADAVVLAACVEAAGVSPGNCWDDCEVPEADISPGNSTGACELAPPADAEPAPDEDDDPDGKVEVGTLRGSGAAALALLAVWPLGCEAVWPCAAAMPRNMIAMPKTSFNRALLHFECREAAPSAQDNARYGKNENEILERYSRKITATGVLGLTFV
jgi:hypothetical protein